jgi:murein DD-endopeptidase MepM/ murein hydrolase activator NlpD
MKQILLSIVSIPVVIVILFSLKSRSPEERVSAKEEDKHFTIAGIVQAKETMETIFSKHNLDKAQLNEIYNKSKGTYNLSKITVGSVYAFELDGYESTIQRMQYGIDDHSFLHVMRRPDGFSAEKVTLPVNKRSGIFHINIENNLISSMPGTHKEYLELALELSDIYAWDIDFSNDIRKGDTVKIIVEEQWVGAVFRGYGNILAAEFINNGKSHLAYRFEHDGYVDYFDDKGRSLKKTLLRSPLKFKYVSSRFNRRRFHPLLRIYRPHLGVDYAAPTGTPVSAAGSGTIMFAGRKGQNGRMVKIKHPGGYVTYYGHLSRIPRKILKGSKVSQGDIIGYVGSTGLSTGPHLDYRIKHNGRFVNPLNIRLPRGRSISKNVMAEFRRVVDAFNTKLASITGPVVASKEKKKTSG